MSVTCKSYAGVCEDGGGGKHELPFLQAAQSTRALLFRMTKDKNISNQHNAEKGAASPRLLRPQGMRNRAPLEMPYPSSAFSNVEKSLQIPSRKLILMPKKRLS